MQFPFKASANLGIEGHAISFRLVKGFERHQQ
jgi:hypothetical protein